MKGMLFKKRFNQAIAEGRKTQTRRIIKSGDILPVAVKIEGGHDALFLYRNEDREAEINISSNLWLREIVYVKHRLYDSAAKAELFIMITRVRVERLQDISEEDAKREGVEIENPGTIYHGKYHNYKGLYWHLFADLWDEINGGRGYSFASNPLVWVIDFERVARPE